MDFMVNNSLPNSRVLAVKKNSLKTEKKYTWGKYGSIYGTSLFNKYM